MRGARAVLVFVKQPVYRAVLGFAPLAKTVADVNVGKNIREALEAAIATAKLKD